ncbi:MAG TPA: hypothetical protein VJ844_06160 [Mucilaginibacter sp.]|nr:hypothetical protein [Mucilaginibacter sp.]
MKKYLITITPILVLAFILQSCVTAKITSNKEASYTSQPKRVFILLKGAKQSKDFSNGFLAGLQAGFKEKGVTTDSYVRDPLSLDTKEDINKKINDFSPEALMLIEQKVVHSTNGMVDGGRFEISLIDGASRKPVWKGEFEVYGQFGIDDAVNKGVKEIFKKFIEDKIVNP